MKKGFSVVELIMTIAIIGILASLATVQTLRSQMVARDSERADDVRAISIYFQEIYNKGQPDGNVIPSGDAGVTTAVPMGYPSTSLQTISDTQTTAIFDGLDIAALKSPKMPSSVVAPNFSLIKAVSTADMDNSTATKTAGGVSLSASNDVYVYQPLDANNALCQFATGLVSTGIGVSATTGKTGVSTQQVIAPRLANNCVKFNIFYYSEIKEIIIKVQGARNSTDGLY